MDSDAYIKKRHLEEAIGYLATQQTSLHKAIAQTEFDLETIHLELEAERVREATLLKELEGAKSLAEKTRRLEFDIHKATSQRDFHAKHHKETKTRLKSTKANDFQLASLKKELDLKVQEVEFLKTKAEKTRNEIENVLVFGERPQAAHNAPVETFYAKKVADLEDAIAKMESENATLEAQAPNRPSENGAAKVADPRELMMENEILTMKIEELKKENVTLRDELAKAKAAVGGVGPGTNQEDPAATKARFQASLQRLVKDLESLKQENNRLAGGAKVRKLGDLGGGDLTQKLTNAGVEKRVLQQKVAELRAVVAERDQEIENLRADSPDNDAIQHLIDANKRMSAELNRLQEQFRRMEQMSNHSFGN